MNEEKNNLGFENSRINNSSQNGVELPPMGMSPTGLAPMETITSENVSKDNIVQNNNMNNVLDKYGLPPISNFTNFNSSYEFSEADSNTSVFDLMDHFDSVNNTNNQYQSVQNSGFNANLANKMTTNNANSITNNQSFITSVNPSAPEINNIPKPVDNNQNKMLTNNTINQLNNVDHTLDIFNVDINTQHTSSSSVNNNVQQNNHFSSIPSFDNNSIDHANEVKNNISSINVEPNVLKNSLNNEAMNKFSGKKVEPIIHNTQNNVSASNINVNSNHVNNFAQSLTTDDSALINTQERVVVPSNDNNSSIDIINNPNNQGANNETSIVTVSPTSVINNSELLTNDQNSIQNIDTNNTNILEKTNNIPSIVNQVVDNSNIVSLSSGDKPVEIPTTSIEETINNDMQHNLGNSTYNIESTNKDTSAENLATAFDTNNTVVDNLNNIINANSDTNSINEINKTKKKKKKLLFIIMLIITILLLVAVGILSYFMFFKSDKLVCGFQDYSNDQYILDESMVYRFKGNKIANAKFSKVLTFTEDNLELKDSYLEDLKNQYQGLGFNVSFIENEDGFEIDMDFTKSELESWYGTNLKNSSKNQMKKEMRDSGYTCK